MRQADQAYGSRVLAQVGVAVVKAMMVVMRPMATSADIR